MKSFIYILGFAAIIAVVECGYVWSDGIMLDPTAKVDFQEQVGDITYLKPPGDKREKRGAVSNDYYLWANGVVEYNLTEYFTEKEKITILSAMRHWEDHTCIRFVPVRDRTRDHITLYPGIGCSSYIGRIRANQGVSLGRSCFAFHTIVHELGHVLGFYHEQSRPDRDDYIDVIYENIVRGAEPQFAIVPEHRIQTGGVGYDYNSIMHYDRNLFSRDLISDTIVAKDPNIPVGGATELSEFDKVETNRLYRCDTVTPGPKTVVPDISTPPFPPKPFACGETIEAESGEFAAPDHDDPLECVWMIRVPEGFHVRIVLKPLSIPGISPACPNGFVEAFDTIDGSGRGLGHICGNWRQYTLGTIDNVAYLHFVSNGQGHFEASFDTVDKNECALGYCSHGCNNFPGGYECTCPDGYFLSADGNQCFDVNECALNAAGCDHICMNTGGSYRCECDDGFDLQSDGKTCLPPGVVLPEPEPSVLPTVLEPDIQAVTTQPPTTRPTTATTQPPTQAGCGGRLTTASGSLQSPNWPQTYNVDEVCEWTIELPDPTSTVRITFERQGFGIAGYTPDCSKDVLEIFDGANGARLDVICGVVLPDPITTSSNVARIVFTAGPAHGSGRKGFKLDYESIAAPTTQPPTTRPTTATTQPPTTRPTTATTQPPTTRPITATTQPPTQAGCGGWLTTDSGSLQSPNWPQTYNVNEECEWIIELPDHTSTIEISFDNEDEFGIAGVSSACTKDVLEIFDGLGSNAATLALICGTEVPDPIPTSSNVARIVFTAGPAHGPLRRGFKLHFKSVAAPTSAPMLIVQTSPECENFLTMQDNQIIKSPNWPVTYPVNLRCEWLITVSDPSKVLDISFDDHFGIAGSTSQNCPKDRLQIYDGHESNAASLGAYCEFAVPPTRRTSSNKAKITFTALGAHGPARVGFKATFTCV